MSVLADWLVRQAPAWLDASRPLTPAQRRALHAIQRCRTPALGGCVYRCDGCAGTDFAYHSCHHRACPRCGGNRAAAWTAQQEARLLPVGYFLVTFTVPQELRGAFATRPELMHDLLFAQSAAALQAVASNPRHLGGELGMIGVLHTWGRQLQHHPHVHYIVPGGALSPDRKRWRPARAGGTWLLPGCAVAAAFRTGFRDALQAAAPDLHAQIGDAVWRDGWWVHTQPAGSGESVVRYLARYVARTAISDERIVAADDHAVTFHYTDTATHQRRECTLPADEFLRRYLQHVLPPGQHRVRYPPKADKLRLAASRRPYAADDRGDAARCRHRRARESRWAAALAPALPALRRVCPRACRATGARAARLYPMNRGSSLAPSVSPDALPGSAEPCPRHQKNTPAAGFTSTEPACGHTNATHAQPRCGASFPRSAPAASFAPTQNA